MLDRVEIVAEVGINHNGDVDAAMSIIKMAVDSGVDAIKMQKRIPTKDVPLSQQTKVKSTPWGDMSYIDYKKRMEFGNAEYNKIVSYCYALSVPFFVSVWGIDSLAWMENNYPLISRYKVPSACLQDQLLLNALNAIGKPVVISTGMSTEEDVAVAVSRLGSVPLTICHTNSTYPAPPDELNLRAITWLKTTYPEAEIGYSGHETGLAPTLAAVALGAIYVERHVTMDRAMWGTDQAASIETGGIRRLVKDIRLVEKSLGDGVKRVMPSEQEARIRLRGV